MKWAIDAVAVVGGCLIVGGVWLQAGIGAALMVGGVLLIALALKGAQVHEANNVPDSE